MEHLKNVYRGVGQFCSRVIEWRSTCTVPYLFIVNAIFWYIVFYTSMQVQMRSLAGLACIVFCNDVLLSPTHERSIIVQVLIWPIQNLWKTIAVGLCGVAIHQLGESKTEEALWCSATAVSCLLIAPVYKYNKINTRIASVFYGAGKLIKSFLTYWIVRPILYVYDFIKYVLLFRWLNGLKHWLSTFKSSIYEHLDRLILQRLRAFTSKCANFLRYWIYFYWLADLRSLLRKHVGVPLLNRIRVLRNYLVYVFGGYWFAPLMKHAGRGAYQLFCHFMFGVNKCMIAIGNSVLYPLLVATYEQVKEIGYVVYDTTGRPIITLLHHKYKRIEDFVLIYFIAPAVKTLIDCVPEKNPFAYESDDHELDEFIPGPVSDPVEEEALMMEVENATTSSESSADEKEFDTEMLDDLDDETFLTKRLQKDFSATDSSDEEFMLYPKQSAIQQQQNQRRKR